MSPFSNPVDPSYTRYVAIGDSSTEGFNDFGADGEFVGWSRRLAGKLAKNCPGEFYYKNFGHRGLTTAQIHEQQLASALKLRPDLITLFSGTNDVLGLRFDGTKLHRDLRALHTALAEAGCTVLTFTLPDLVPVLPMARLIASRVYLLNDLLREISAETGSILVDFAAYPVASDSRLWHEDRLHANSDGHRLMADAMAHALDVPGANEDWKINLPPPPRKSLPMKLGAEAYWLRKYYLPWIGLRMRQMARIR